MKEVFHDLGNKLKEEADFLKTIANDTCSKIGVKKLETTAQNIKNYGDTLHFMEEELYINPNTLCFTEEQNFHL